MKKITQLFLITTAVILLGFDKPQKTTISPIQVVIDVSHGGTDAGAIKNGISEKQLVEALAKKIKSTNNDVRIHFTRNEDKTLTLQERTEYINSLKPDFVLSIHINANKDNTKSGLELYTSQENKFSDKSVEKANELRQKLLKHDFFKSSSVKTAPFYILKNSNAPAVIVELGFLTNENDYKYLTDSNSQDKIASSISEYLSELK
ncbi:N-acetylmuramoyl-L-alanine amidase [Flavobacterium nitratireducens]|uniref:N-acetylmuramoyl-L-alanine amidase n=1 Tax=Flavobacterium nitratireducens TaxID=992289 RepID=UPI0024156B43|nr:N-acetylmuramoyl-L-alanine amidase [Flavobacterium nitratireducens]